jgi:hypothetical protein
MARALRAAAGLAVLVLTGCGGDGDGATGNYAVAPARDCFEQAAYPTTVKKLADGSERLTVFERTEGGTPSGPAYLIAIFTASSADAQERARAGDDARGNVVLRGDGITDDVTTQCLLEAKTAS